MMKMMRGGWGERERNRERAEAGRTRVRTPWKVRGKRAEDRRVFEGRWVDVVLDNVVTESVRQGLQSLYKEHLKKLPQGLRGNEVKWIQTRQPAIHEYYNSLVDEVNSQVVCWRKTREQLCSVLADKVNKEDLSARIDESVVMSCDMNTGESRKGMIHEDSWDDGARESGSKWQVRRRLGGRTREEDIGSEMPSGEQDKKKGRKGQRRRELLLLWEAPPVGPPVGDGKTIFFFSFPFFS